MGGVCLLNKICQTVYEGANWNEILGHVSTRMNARHRDGLLYICIFIGVVAFTGSDGPVSVSLGGHSDPRVGAGNLCSE